MRCPDCNSDNVTREPPLKDEGIRPDEYECHDCGYAWLAEDEDNDEEK